MVHVTATSGRSGAVHHQSMIERSGSSFTNLVRLTCCCSFAKAKP